MRREIFITADGSHSIEMPEINVSYHSKHGAIQESMHVFINAGLIHCINSAPSAINIFEMGFGTGLNALLTLIEAEKNRRGVYYETVEADPLNASCIDELNYCEQLNRKDLQPLFKKLHTCAWNTATEITSYFSLKKINQSILDLSGQPINQKFNLIYYDAFAPAAQPELWTKEVFEKLFMMLGPEGILVTYCSKGDGRRAMQAAGFVVQKLKGPPGKREMVKCIKPKV